jgi:hypothetical protein
MSRSIGKNGRIYPRSADNTHNAGSLPAPHLRGPSPVAGVTVHGRTQPQAGDPYENSTFGVTLLGRDGMTYSFHVSSPRAVAELLRDSDYLDYSICDEPRGGAIREMDPAEAAVFAERAKADLPENKPLNVTRTEFSVRLVFPALGGGAPQEYVFPAADRDGVLRILADCNGALGDLEIVETSIGTVDGEDGEYRRHREWSKKAALDLWRESWSLSR